MCYRLATYRSSKALRLVLVVLVAEMHEPLLELVLELAKGLD